MTAHLEYRSASQIPAASLDGELDGEKLDLVAPSAMKPCIGARGFWPCDAAARAMIAA